MILSTEVMLVSQWNSGSSCFRRQTRKGKESRDLPFSSFFQWFWLLVFVSVDVSILPKSPPKKKVGKNFKSWIKFPGKNMVITVDDFCCFFAWRKDLPPIPRWHVFNEELLGMHPTFNCLAGLSRWNNSSTHLEKNISRVEGNVPFPKVWYLLFLEASCSMIFICFF